MTNIRIPSDENIKQIKYFYKRPMPIGFATVFILAFGSMLPIVFSLGLRINPFFMLLPFWIIVIGIDQYLHRRKISRAAEVYEYGYETDIILESVSSNYGYTMNRMPQQIITIRRGNELIKVKTFSPRVISAFSHSVQKAYMYDRYPDVLLPSAIFSRSFYDPSCASKPEQKSRSINI